MPNNKIVKRGEIYWVHLPMDEVLGSEQYPNRPALIIQNDIGNKYSSITIVAFLTSSKEKSSSQFPLDIIITQEDCSNLPKNSVILCNQIRTISQERLKEKIGILSREKMAEVEQALKESLELS